MRSGERGGGGLTKKGRLTINNTGGHPSSGAGGGELNTKSNRLRPETDETDGRTDLRRLTLSLTDYSLPSTYANASPPCSAGAARGPRSTLC
jgi:hypothetical protein